MPPSGSAALFLCKTKHTRFSPVSNTFQYSYLVLGLPISLDGHTQNPFIDYNIFLQFFSLRERDYLLRTLEPLHEKLDHYLEEENLSLNDFSKAFLVTAPRFLGHAFNPISFWYLYDKNGQLSVVVLEVSNTFDEKHIYILKNTPNSPTSTKITLGFEKKLFVSPFNERDGSYRIETTDPLQNPDNMKMNAQISLLDDSGKLKLHASLRSEVPGVLLEDMGLRETLRYSLLSGWIILGTEIRTLAQAARLFIGLKLPIYKKPVVLNHLSLGRHMEQHERTCEKLFSTLLKKRVVESKTPLKMRYYASAGCERIQNMQSLRNSDFENDDSANGLLLIKKPEFYGLWIAVSRNNLSWEGVLAWAITNEYIETSIPLESLAILTAPFKDASSSGNYGGMAIVRLWIIGNLSTRIGRLANNTYGIQNIQEFQIANAHERLKKDDTTPNMDTAAIMWVLIDAYVVLSTSWRLHSLVFWSTTAISIVGASAYLVVVWLQ